jgi:hypothetical protein
MDRGEADDGSGTVLLPWTLVEDVDLVGIGEADL